MSENEHGGLSGMMDKMQDAIGGMVGVASAGSAGSHAAPAFVMNAGMGDLYEIEAGRLALERSGSAAVKVFAEMMVAHHTTSRHQLQSALHMHEVFEAEPDLRPPAGLDHRREGMLDHLRQAPAEDFDSRYLDQQALAHRETLALLKGYGENGSNPQLASYARSGVPMVERHIKELQRLRDA